MRIGFLALLPGLVLVGCGSGGGGGSDAGADAAPPDPSRLAGLEVSAGELTPAFDPSVLSYTVAAPLGAEYTTVTATAAVPGSATLALAGDTLSTTALASGVASDPLSLTIRGVAFEVTVTPDSGNPVTYQVTVNRGAGMQQRAYLKASLPVVDGGFGTSVAMAGERIAVGEPGASGGQVHVFVRAGDAWTEEDVLLPGNPGVADRFGWSVAFGDDATLAIGAPGEDSASLANPDDNSLESAGAAYVFVRTGSSWSQQVYLKASNPRAGAEFGHRVALAGTSLVVSAPAEPSATKGINGSQSDTSAPGAGAVYAFAYSGAWLQEAYIKASDSEAGDRFGDDLARNGDLVAVGAPGWDAVSPVAIDQGLVYVLRRSGTTWSQEDALVVTTGAGGLGSAVAAGDPIAFGAPADSGGGGIHVFTPPGTGNDWPEEIHLLGSDAPGVTRLGDRVAVGNFVPTVIAATAQTADGAEVGLVGRAAANDWPWLGAMVSDNLSSEDLFGASLAFAYPTVVVGAPGEASNGDPSDDSVAGSGAVYVFE